MSKMIATRIPEETYIKILKKCGDLGCSTYDYLKLLIETDTKEPKKELKIEI